MSSYLENENLGAVEPTSENESHHVIENTVPGIPDECAGAANLAITKQV